jgi:hypothetical protein
VLKVFQRFDNIAVAILMVNDFGGGEGGVGSSYITFILDSVSGVKPWLDEQISVMLDNRKRSCGHLDIFHPLFSLTT